MNATQGIDRASELALTRRIKAQLDAQTEHLEPAVTRRLARARHEAVRYAMPSPSLWLRQWAPAAGVATAAMVAVMMWPAAERLPGSPDRIPQPLIEAQLDDIEIILAEESLDLYEDLEFFQWLGAQQDMG